MVDVKGKIEILSDVLYFFLDGVWIYFVVVLLFLIYY